ncbi:putative mannosyl-3-phosphoglycerate synthase [Xylariomycetidae sp. FL2044]|nr:putative mannosyl-3-phosphoglycerate synthase [Xylariomycetidae sp. FL2044]
MRLGVHPRFQHLGNVEIRETLQVLELDSGHFRHRRTGNSKASDVVVSPEALAAVEAQLAIVVPCMNENPNIIEGVLSGIPHDCLIILVSNSSRAQRKSQRRTSVANSTVQTPTPTFDGYEEELARLQRFCEDAHRPAIAVHQQDLGVARAFRAAGMPELVDDDYRSPGNGKIRKGKGEAMIIGMALAALTGKKYIGYVDADNYVPGSVHEYCKVYAAGLHHASSRPQYASPLDQPAAGADAMVRILWGSKPKWRDGELCLDKKGRSSRVLNEWLNRLMQELAGDEESLTGAGARGRGSQIAGPPVPEGLITTGNAGEHAMSMDLGLKLRLASGYAIEPFHFIDVWEQFGVALPLDASASPPESSDDEEEQQQSRHRQPRRLQQRPAFENERSADRKVQILQIESRNPHFHDSSKGEGHVRDMQIQGLSTLYHSPLMSPSLRADLHRFMVDHEMLERGQAEPPRSRVYPPVGTLNFCILREMLKAEARSLVEITCGTGAEGGLLG